MAQKGLAQKLEDFGIFGEAALVVLGEQQPAVGDHVEHAVVALDQFGIDAQLTRNLGRQTGGLG